MGEYGSPELYPYNNNKKKPDDNIFSRAFKIFIHSVGVIFIAFLLLICISWIYSQSLNETALKSDNIKHVETTALDKFKNEQSEDEFKQSCVEIEYKEFMRYPDEHKGDKVKLECKVTQNVRDTLGNFAYYRVNTR